MLFFKMMIFLIIAMFNVVTGKVPVGSPAERCDQRRMRPVREGNLGQSAQFNWLGVLNVHIQDGDSNHTAVSGIVLIKIKYALANADDVVRIPQRIFKTSRAMFLVAHNTPWYVATVSYVIHPEYDSFTFNSIAVVELDIRGVQHIMVTPICLPTPDTYNSSSPYLTGFTDEHQLLEKVIHKIKYLDKEVCEQFYDSAGLSSQKSTPTAYFCGHAPRTVSQCVWDNGMALVSNATGIFTLIGMAVHGPGCAAPSRFIDLVPYYSWIQSVILPEEQQATGVPSDDEEDDDDDIQYIPIHDLFRMKPSRRAEPPQHVFEPYPFNTEVLKHFFVEPSEDNNTISIVPVDDMWEEHTDACAENKTLMYHEIFDLQTSELQGVVTYKINCTQRSEASLSFREEISLQGDPLPNEDLTPDEIIRYQHIVEYQPEDNSTAGKKTQKSDKYDPANAPHLKPAFLENKFLTLNVLNYDLYVTFQFKDYAEMRFEMYAPIKKNITEDENATTTTTIKPKGRRIFEQKLYNTSVEDEEIRPDSENDRSDDKNERSKARNERLDDESERSDQMYEQMQAPPAAMASDDVQETFSKGRSERAAGLVVLICWMISAYLMRGFFSHQSMTNF